MEMTREEAIRIISLFREEWDTNSKTPNARALDMAIEALKQWPCKNRLAIERLQDLVDFFGDKDIAKEILEDREEFIKWLDRMKRNVGKVDELARELDQLKESYEVEVERNAELQQQLDRASAPEYKYRMVRSHTPNCYKPHDDLDTYLEAGYEFVNVSEFIPLGDGKSGYIEYILRRKKEDNDD